MTARLSRIFWLGLKELASLGRDRVLLGLLIYSFSLGLIMEATGLSSSVNNASIAFVDEDRSALSRTLAAAFMPPEFQPVQAIRPGTAGAAMDAGRFLFVVSVPPGFEADLRAGRMPEIQVLIDATAMQQAGIGAGYIESVLTAEIAHFAEAHALDTTRAVDLVLHSAFNPTRDTVRFVAIVSLVNNVTMLTVILTGAALIRERERGTIEHLLAMPLAPVDIAMAKIWANGAVVLVVATLSLLFVIEGALGVETSGSRALFLAGVALYLFSATALGVFLAVLARSMAQFALLVILAILPLQMLSGGDTPVEGQPDWLRTLTLALPSRHFVEFGQAIVFKGAGLSVVWPGFAAVTAIGVALLLASLALFRRSLSIER